MRRRWYYWRRRIRAYRPLFAEAAAGILLLMILAANRERIYEFLLESFLAHGVRAAGTVLEGWFPGVTETGEDWSVKDQIPLLSWIDDSLLFTEPVRDPGYKNPMKEIRDEQDETKNEEEKELPDESVGGNTIPASGTAEIFMEKLSDFDYLMKNFYIVHANTTAGRQLLDADRFMHMELSLEKNGAVPQILIYHTHSQEEYADHNRNPEATVVGVGVYLTELLEKRGYRVIHDTSVYDLQNGKLDRSQAYTYALEGITGILQENPSIEVVLDIHRDGVSENTRLVKEIAGRPTAQIMFFNGTSQTPEGPIEYLPNPNREANLAFSFRLQLAAMKKYPGFTRKIYLKGLRYTQHVRARTALIEVGAQTNTYEEARNAMEPLADLIDQVLSGQDN